MKKNELKKILKPLIKECVKEVIFEKGVLSSIILEVATGLNAASLTEVQRKEPVEVEKAPKRKTNNKPSKRLHEQKQKLLDAIGKDAYKGIDIFEGVEPMSGENSYSSLSTQARDDQGVDITSIPGMKNWKHLVDK